MSRPVEHKRLYRKHTSMVGEVSSGAFHWSAPRPWVIILILLDVVYVFVVIYETPAITMEYYTVQCGHKMKFSHVWFYQPWSHMSQSETITSHVNEFHLVLL